MQILLLSFGLALTSLPKPATVQGTFSPEACRATSPAFARPVLRALAAERFGWFRRQHGLTAVPRFTARPGDLPTP